MLKITVSDQPAAAWLQSYAATQPDDLRIQEFGYSSLRDSLAHNIDVREAAMTAIVERLVTGQLALVRPTTMVPQPGAARKRLRARTACMGLTVAVLSAICIGLQAQWVDPRNSGFFHPT